MRNQLQKCTVIKVLLCAALLLFGGAAWAQVAGKVTRLSGPLMAKKANGSVKVLSLRSEVENGDTLVSEKNTYAQIKFIDNSEITLRPGTTFRIDNFAFDEGKPGADAASFSLVKGGLRSITGVLGKRNKEKFALKTPSATIGIRGTTFVAQYVPAPSDPKSAALGDLAARIAANGGKLPDGVSREDVAAVLRSALGSSTAAGLASTPGMPSTGGGSAGSPLGSQLLDLVNNAPRGASGQAGADTDYAALFAAAQAAQAASATRQAPAGLPPGLHVQVIDGMIQLTNNGGTLGFNAGQFGYVPNLTQAPVLVPQNPGLQFTPPPVFNTGTGTTPGAETAQDTAAVDCIVR